MQPKSDAQLLRDYAECGTEAAFTKLVQRHTDLVYSATLRQVESPDIAAEISQNVFVSLARGAKALAPRLTPDASLAGWLCRSARNLSLNHRRDEFRRQIREQQAMEQFISISDAAPDWERLRRLLDDAMSELSETDYDALVLRFYQNQDLKFVGAALGVSDDTAQKRVSRALDKLRDLLVQRGLRTTAAALGIVISANAIHAAPAGLVIAISTAALAGTAAATSTVIAGTTKIIAMTTLQKTVVAATVTMLAGAGIYEARQAAQLREQIQTLQQQQSLYSDQIRQLQSERDDAVNHLAGMSEEVLNARKNNAELLKLRGEVGVLLQQVAIRSHSEENKSVVVESHPTVTQGRAPGAYITKEQLQFVGYDTPEAAIESITWVMMAGTFEQANEVLNPELVTQQATSQKEKERFEARQQAFAPLFKGMQVVARKDLSNGKVELKVKMDSDPIPGESQTMPSYLIQPMSNVDGQWKISGSTREYSEQWDGDGRIQTYTQ